MSLPAHKATHPLRNGLFDPDGVFWRVNRESVLLLGGGGALLLQVAHPKIAAAVADHSNFREHPIRRLYQTIKAMQSIIYGDKNTAFATARRINEIHSRVHGTLKEGTSQFPGGSSYSANDPELVVWVFATLSAMTLKTYGEFVRPLTAEERAAFYLESRRIAELFGAPEDFVPPDLSSFDRYYNDMLEGPVLEITPTAQYLAENIIHPPIRGFPRPLGDIISVPALGLLPETIRTRYGFTWDSKRQRAWNAARRIIPRARSFTPYTIRTNAGARRAERSRSEARR